MDRDDQIREHVEKIIRELRAIRMYDVKLNVPTQYQATKVRMIQDDMQKYRTELEHILEEA